MGQAVCQLCSLTVLVLEGSEATPAGALQRQLAEASALILADDPALNLFLPVVSNMHNSQARQSTPLVCCHVGRTSLSVFFFCVMR